MIPLAVIVWIETQSIAFSIVAAVCPFFLAIIQGTYGILKYRLFYGNSPHPEIPCHGVVIVDPKDRVVSMSSVPSSSSFCLKSSSPEDVHYLSERAINDKRTEPPLRMLVIGDSLAIGVGQKKFSTPIMPEAIAKTLSKAMGGRTIYWSCYGAPGASTGWVIRELENGFQHYKQNRNVCPQTSKYMEGENKYVEGEEDDSEKIFVLDDNGDHINCLGEDTLSDCSSLTDMDANSLFDTSSEQSSGHEQQTRTPPEPCKQNERRRSVQVWKERLKEHRKRFDSEAEVMGPYDIVVLITGANDLKGVFLPNFLLSGDAKEFRRLAKERGGYDSELRRVLDTLFQKMGSDKTFCEPVDNFQESKEKNVTKPLSPEKLTQLHCSREEAKGNKDDNDKALNYNAESHLPVKADDDSCFQEQEIEIEYEQEEEEQKDPRFPLVVLPGMPAQLLPVFRKRPLHWLAVPAVAMMDCYKRNLARSLPGKVLFVEANRAEELNKYKAQKGIIWEQRCNEETLLSLKDIQKSQSNCIEEEMKIYHQRKSTNLIAKLFQDTGTEPYDELVSVDGVHVNDEGYDFWGRSLASSIIQELEKRSSLSAAPSNTAAAK